MAKTVYLPVSLSAELSLGLGYIWKCISKFPAPDKGLNSAFSEANTTLSGVWAFKQMTVESSPLLHPVVCCGATDRNNPARKYVSLLDFHSLPFICQNTEHMYLTYYDK